jgi:ParB family transcriptional regulator, chromosome partitioning protein
MGPGAGYEVENLPAAVIMPNPYQPRQSFGEEGLQELASSIREHGVLQPIVVRRGGEAYEVVAGERRLRAARMAGLERVPVIIRECTNEEALALALIENLQREEISPLEAARAYRRLNREFGLTQDEIAERVGKSRSAIANALRLLQLDPAVQARLEAGEITEGHARTLVTLESPERQREVCEQLVQRRATVREAERLVRDAARPAAPAAAPKTRTSADPNVAEVESSLRSHLGTRVAISRGRAHGTITIEFYGDEDLERIVGLLLGNTLAP